MEIIIVLVIGLIVLGPKRLPDAGRSIGRGLREFKGAVSGGNDDDEREERELAAIQPAAAKQRVAVPRQAEPVA
jgi:sec-independent protein translocase protein TatA